MRFFLSTFHFVVFLCFVIKIVEGEKVREYTVAFKGSDEEAETIIVQEKPQSPPPKHSHAPPKHVHIHPIHEAREFLGEHNKIRKELGEPLLKWDKKLAHYARRFAAKRAVTCDMIHSLGPYGENIYWGADYLKHTAAVAVRAWAGETNNYNPMKNTCDPFKACGHYKQMVWKTSTKLGCARTKCNSGGVYIICSYDPPGNYLGESPFDTPESSETPPSTPTSAQTKTPSTPSSAQTKTPTPPTSAQTKTHSTPSTSAQTKTPSTPSSAQTKTPTPPTSAQTKTPSTPTSGQTKTHSTPTSAHTQTPSTSTPAQTKTPSTPTSGQTKTHSTPTFGHAHTKTPSTSTPAKTKTPVQTPTTHGGAKTKPTSPSTPS